MGSNSNYILNIAWQFWVNLTVQQNTEKRAVGCMNELTIMYERFVSLLEFSQVMYNFSVTAEM